MKKHLPIFLFILVCCLSCNDAPVRVLGKQDYGKVMFENDNFDDVIAAAKAQNKPIFLDVYTNWCGWCKRLDITTYQDPQVIKYLNTNFIPLKVNAESGRGYAVKVRYGVNSYPRLLFLDSDGKPLLTIKGYRDAKGLLQAATKAADIYKSN